MRRFLLTTAVAATALVSAACGDTTGLGSNLAGSYELRTVNNFPLPVTNQSQTQSVIAGQLELDNDGDFVEIVEYETSSGFVFDEERFGTWERSGDEIIFEYSDGETRVGERTSNSRILIRDEFGNDWSYQRF